jgi:hypothetical protein
MKFSRLILFFLFSIYLTSCKDKVAYESETELKSFIANKTSIDVSKGKLIFFVLQSSDCICTDENIDFTLNVIKNKKYEDYKKVLLVLSKSHKIFSKIKGLSVDAMNIKREDMYNSGLLITTDRIFVLNGGEIEKFSDMHTVSHKELISQYL